MRLSASRRPGAAPRPSQLVSQDIFQRLEVEGLVGDDPLQLAVLVLELLEPLRVRNLHAAVLPLPGLQGLSDHAEPAEKLAHVRACPRLLARSNLPLHREPALGHDSPALGAQESDYKWIRFRGSAHPPYADGPVPHAGAIAPVRVTDRKSAPPGAFLCFRGPYRTATRPADESNSAPPLGYVL